MIASAFGVGAITLFVIAIICASIGGASTAWAVYMVCGWLSLVCAALERRE